MDVVKRLENLYDCLRDGRVSSYCIHIKYMYIILTDHFFDLLQTAYGDNSTSSQSNCTVYSNRRLCQCPGGAHAHCLRHRLCSMCWIHARLESLVTIRIRVASGFALNSAREPKTNIIVCFYTIIVCLNQNFVYVCLVFFMYFLEDKYKDNNPCTEIVFQQTKKI